ncbi:MAG: hypothetical protein WC841_01120 [Candidatus Shapirobacteria bacterium]|jgi:hypothetical protein
MIKEISLLTLSPETIIASDQISQIAILYADVFRGPPWNEAVKCNSCKKYEEESVAVNSPCPCGGYFSEAYPLSETKGYIESESQIPGFRLTLVKDKEQVVGFAWSYLTTPAKLVVAKWSDPQNQQSILKVLERNDLTPNTQFRYFCEIGIAPEYRGLGLSNYLSKQVVGSEPTLFRTNIGTKMMAVGATLGFEQIMGPEVTVDRSGGIIIPTGKIFNRLDSEREDRVLFLKS